MADEFQSGICGGNWWNSSSRTGFNEGSAPCSTGLNDVGSLGWSTEMVDINTRSCEESASVSGSSIVFQDTQKPQGSDCVGGAGGVLMDSTLQMMSFGLSSPTIDWNHEALLRSSGRAESNFHAMLQEDLGSRPNFRDETGMESHHQVKKEWSPKNFSSGGEDSSINAFKQMNQVFALDQQHLNSVNSSAECTVTCHGLPSSFPMGSTSYGYSSTLLHGLLEPEPQTQQIPFDNRSMNYLSPGNYRINSNDFSPSWPKSPQFLRTSPPKQLPSSQLHFSNNAPFWNASAAAMTEVRSSFLPSPQTQFLSPTFDEKPNCSNLTSKRSTEEVRDSGSVMKKSSGEPAFKRPRIETPSPVPTFKVRKEKLGDRITALQQLVSPFGKTDTASVLFEAIDYIKFLHGQVSNSDKSKDHEGPKQDLQSRGLCLVPVSNIIPVTNETATDFWMPTFGGTFR
ncbi:hypothetical protein HHK36_003460 [Tetracentron sinense]|uniref:BHLH domain-containing protein n=1 Tax=Tetracentron sinense TaxID=13715 RepID=A0A835DNN2_TETSI|nr:hypothetical protein HHK36_003460 [Tetracentron sinense]